MFSAFQTFGKLGAMASSVARAWSPLALWPDGIASPGMWIDPSLLTASFNDYLGTTPVEEPGTVADSANPVGLALDIRAGATAVTDPGNHLLQATSTARPLLSARVNLLTYTEDFSNAVWGVQGATKTTGVTAPDGTATAMTLAITANGGNNLAHTLFGVVSNPFTAQAQVKGPSGAQVFFAAHSGAEQTLVTFTGDWQLVENTQTMSGTCYYSFEIYNRSGGAHLPNVTFDIWHPHLNIGPTALPYQYVNTASDYASTGITPFQLYDGTDDGMATASFAAGTLTSSMDCLIAVRRDSAANAVCGLYESVAEANKVFGIAESGSGSGCAGSGAGTPTVWVDNVQLTGGTAVTRDTLHTALTAGAFHILEFRGLDLSTWTASGFGLYTSYKLPGARGDIMLYPSTASTTDKDAARQYLADKYGVTLP